LDSDLRLLKHVEEELAVLDQMLAEQGYQEEQVKLLMTLPGVSLAVAQTLLAALGNIDRFSSPDEAASYLGLVPSTRQSADHCYHGPITKAGRGHARWMLIQAAHHARNQPGPLGVFFRRLTKKKNYNVAVVATARKLVVIAWHMLKHNEPYRYAQPKQTEIKLARLRVKATGRRRKPGPAKSTKCQAKLPGGSYTIKPLAKVYQQEGLPELRLPKEAERRMLRRNGVAPFAESLAGERTVARRRGTPQTANP
jgi:transposase